MNETTPQDDIIDIEPKIVGESDSTRAPSKPQRWALAALPYAALALASALAGGWFYKDWLSSYLPTEKVLELSKRVSLIESSSKESQKRVDAVVALTEEFKAKLSAAQVAAEKATKQNGDTAALVQNSAIDLTALKQDFAKLSAATAELQARPVASVNGSVAAPDPALAARVAQLEKQATIAPAASGLEAPDYTAPLKTLKAQVASGQPFAVALAPLARALPAAPGLDVLGAERAGLASSSMLATELDGLRATLPKPVAAEDSGIWASIKGAFGKLVKVRGTDDWSTLSAKAAAFAAAGDVEQAAGVFVKADSGMPPTLKAWAEKAQRRVKLDKATDAFAAALSRAGLAKE